VKAPAAIGGCEQQQSVELRSAALKIRLYPARGRLQEKFCVLASAKRSLFQICCDTAGTTAQVNFANGKRRKPGKTCALMCLHGGRRILLAWRPQIGTITAATCPRLI
jgi:hypothetical protein